MITRDWTYTELVRQIAAILPNATFMEAEDGELVIATSLCQTGGDDDLLEELVVED